MASSRTRAYQFLPYLQKEGLSIKIIVAEPYLDAIIDMADSKIKKNLLRALRKSFKVFKWWNLLKLLLFSFFSESIIIQKVILPKWFMFLLSKSNQILLFDFDDAIFLNLDPHSLDLFNNTLKICKGVILENDYNAKYVHKFNTNILKITGPIECNYYFPSLSKNNGNVVLGWIGSPSTEKYLNSIMPVIRTLLNEYENLRCLFVGLKSSNVYEHKRIHIYPWNLGNELELLSEMDIGIMPLYNTDWERGKGGYKALVYMSMKIPPVVTPVEILKEIVIDSLNGFHAVNEQQWYDRLKTLIDSPEKRSIMGGNARDTVIKKYSYESSVPPLIGFINKFKDNQ